MQAEIISHESEEVKSISQTMPSIRLLTKKKIAPKPKKNAKSVSKSRRDCKACLDMHSLSIKVTPIKFS